MWEITKSFEIAAAHYIEGYSGDCSNLHGHTYKGEVTVIGDCLDELGMVIDFKILKTIIDTIIVKELHHSYFNDFLPFNPTTENLAKWIYDKMCFTLDNYNKKVPLKVKQVILSESETSKVCYTG